MTKVYQNSLLYIRCKIWTFYLNHLRALCRGHAAGGTVGWGTALQTRRSRVRFSMVSLKFFIDLVLWPSNRNEYQEYFLGVKAAGAYGWQPYHLNMPIVLKSGSIKLLEPSGPVQVCNGIALPLSVSSHVFWFEVPPVWISTRHHPTYKNNIIFVSHIYNCCQWNMEPDPILAT